MAGAGELPSQVEETLAICPRFRIVLVGNTGVGKSSLVSAVFNIVFNANLETTIDIAHDRVGTADIHHEYYSDQNPRFILHDSMGFEPGSTEKSEIVKKFLQDRAGNAELSEQVHAIWLCIETPRTGSRLLQTGDEEMLKLAEQLNIPVIIVFTKYDLLIVQHFRATSTKLPQAERKEEAKRCADIAFKDVTKDLKVPFVPVTMNKPKGKEFDLRVTTLLKLTDVTRDHLKGVGVEGSLWALWATAQQINSRQKVELSISEGFKKYWRNLGESVFFEGRPLADCIGRIHDDILKVWNFNDPHKLLAGEDFLKKMILLVEPLRDAQVTQTQPPDKIAGLAANVVSVAGAVGSAFILPALGMIIGAMAFQFLRNRYKKGASTATYLAVYIVDLTLVLHQISTDMTANPPNSVSVNFIEGALATHRLRITKIHAQVKEVGISPKPEERVAKIIRDAL